jgi:serine/threonine-protein kinase RsbW
VEINMVLYLPRDAASVPVTRQVLDGCLKTLGVTPDTRADIALALSEACANVIQHAGPGDEYEVQASARNGQCAIEVVNTSSRKGKPAPDGSGTSAGEGGGIAVSGDPVPATAEHGRGLQIIDAVVDNLQLTGSKGEGTVVHFEKALKWLPGAVGQHLFSADGRSQTQLGLPVGQQVLGPRGVADRRVRARESRSSLNRLGGPGQIRHEHDSTRSASSETETRGRLSTRTLRLWPSAREFIRCGGNQRRRPCASSHRRARRRNHCGGKCSVSEFTPFACAGRKLSPRRPAGPAYRRSTCPRSSAVGRNRPAR